MLRRVGLSSIKLAARYVSEQGKSLFVASGLVEDKAAEGDGVAYHGTSDDGLTGSR